MEGSLTSSGFSEQTRFDDMNNDQCEITTTNLRESENYNESDCLRKRFVTEFLLCQYSRNKRQFAIKACIFLLIILGGVKIILGSISLNNGYAALVLAEYQDLNWMGSFLIIVGISSVICGIVSCRMIICRSSKTLTSKQIFTVCFIIIYMLLFDIIAIVMASKFNSSTFFTDIEGGMNRTLKERYDVSTDEYKKQWDQFQRNEKCCGSGFYNNWFNSSWADQTISSDKLDSSPLPLSCLLQLQASKACVAFSGSSPSVSSDYILAFNYTQVTECSFEDVFTRKSLFIFAQPCSVVFFQKLHDILLTILLSCSILALIDLVILIVLIRLATKLPRRQQIQDIYAIRSEH